MADLNTGSIGDLWSKVKVTVTENVSKNDEKKIGKNSTKKFNKEIL